MAERETLRALAEKYRDGPAWRWEEAGDELIDALPPALLLRLLDDAERYRALKSGTSVFNSTAPNSGYYYCSTDYLLDSPTGRMPTLDEYADAIRSAARHPERTADAE